MRVLCHGVPFCNDSTPLKRYAGPHEIRRLGIDEDGDCKYDPLNEIMDEIVRRISREWPSEIVMCWTPEIYPPPRCVEDSPIPTLALVSDWHVYYSVLAVNLARFDLVLCDKPGVDVLRSERVTPQYLFPLYSQMTGIHRPHPVPRDLDVVYVGSLHHVTHHRRAVPRAAGQARGPLQDPHRIGLHGRRIRPPA